MSGQGGSHTLWTCRATSSTTATPRTSAGSCSRPSRGHESPLRHRATLASCPFGGHAIWWTVEAAGEREALGLLPYFVAERATAVRVRDVDIP